MKTLTCNSIQTRLWAGARTRKPCGPILLLVLCLGVSLAVTPVLAQTISVNYCQSNDSLPATTSAGVVSYVANWNNVTNSGAGGYTNPVQTFYDSTGASVGVGQVSGFYPTLSQAGYNSFNTGPGASGNTAIFSDWALSGGASGAALTLTGIPYSSYDVYVYYTSFGTTPSAPAVASYALGGNTQTLTNTMAGPGNFGSTDCAAPGFVPDMNYVVFTNLSGSSQTLWVTNGGVSAFQIVSPSVVASSFTITPSAGANGAISPSTAQTVPAGGNYPFTITPNGGYVINQVLVDGTNNADAAGLGIYTFLDLRANHTISVTFAPQVTAGPGTISVNYNIPYTTTPALVPTNIAGAYSVVTNWNNVGSGRGGLAAPVMAFYDNNGNAVSPFAVALSSASSASWNTVGTANQQILGDYALSVGAGGGTLTLSGVPYATYDLYVYYTGIGGPVATYTIGSDTETLADTMGSPNNFNAVGGFRQGVNYVAFRGLTGSSQTMNVTNGGVGAIQIVSPPATLYAITATADGGSTISPAGTVMVLSGSNQTFTISANLGYYLTSVTVDGTGVGTPASYTFSNVTATHTIAVASALAPTYSVSGSVSNAAGSPISGATVYISGSTNASLSSSYTATTAADGTFSISSVPGGTIYLAAGATGYWTSPDTKLSLSASVTGVNFTLNSSARNIPAQSSLLFSAVTESLPASGAISGWPSYLPSGQTFVDIGSPAASTIGNQKWEQNSLLTGTGFRVAGPATNAIPLGSGATIVVAAMPTYYATGGGWNSIVDVLFNQLSLGVIANTGVIEVGVNDTGNNVYDVPTATAIPNGQPTIISLVVSTNGVFTVYANSAPIYTHTATLTSGGFTKLTPNVPGGFAEYLNIGRENPDGWSAYNGFIGDVFVYTNALSTADRRTLEGDLAGKFGIALLPYHTITAMADANSTISPSGTVSVPSGSNQTFAVGANLGYAISSMLVDDVSQTLPLSSYTFTNVTANHAISVASTQLVVWTVSGTVSNAFGGPISGASVFFSTSPNASVSPGLTATTAANGTYTVANVPAGTIYVAAGGTGWWTSPDTELALNANTTGVNFTLNSSTRTIPAQSSLLFSAVTESLPASGAISGWPSYLPSGKTFAKMNNPAVSIIGNQKWEANSYANGTGFLVGTQTNPVPLGSGATIVLAAMPVRTGTDQNWQSVVDVFFNQLSLGVMNGSGTICVGVNDINGTANPNPNYIYYAPAATAIPNGQPTIISLVVSNSGLFVVYTNGIPIWTNTASLPNSGAYTQLNPGARTGGNVNSFASYINLGRENPDGFSVYNGYIGDVFVYTNALANADREALESNLAGKFNIVVPVYVSPTPPAPVLLLSNFTRPGGVPTFAIPNTVSGHQYTLVYKHNLTDNSWTPLTGSGTAPGNGDTITLSDTTASGQPQRFYRVEAQ